MNDPSLLNLLHMTAIQFHFTTVSRHLNTPRSREMLNLLGDGIEGKLLLEWRVADSFVASPKDDRFVITPEEIIALVGVNAFSYKTNYSKIYCELKIYTFEVKHTVLG